MKTEYPNEFTFDHSLKDFFERGIEGLVRENIQNSLDAKNLNKDEPVIVEINNGYLDIKEIPGYKELVKHINSLESYNEYDRATILNMKSSLDKYINSKKDIPFLSFEDSNTTGLSGVPSENNLNTQGSWYSYAYYRGSHHSTYMEKEKFISGGSHGIGKISSNAASELYLMYFINNDSSGNENISGNISLIDHEIKGKKYRGNGVFTDHKYVGEDIKFYPPTNSFSYPFSKKSQGLKILIPFLSPKYTNKTVDIVRAVCDSFFVAILDGRLEVEIDELSINKVTIFDIVKDEKYYPNQNRFDMRDDHTPIYIDTYLNNKLDYKLEVKDGFSNKYTFDLYYQVDEDIKSGRFAIVRKIGMTIENRKVSGFIHNGPFSGIIIPSNSTTDKYIKNLENASHTSLESESIANQDHAKSAKKFLSNLEKEIVKLVESSLKKDEKDTEDIDTSDMIYSTVNILGKNVIKIDDNFITVNKSGKTGLSKDSKDPNFSLDEKSNDMPKKSKGFIGSKKVKEDSPNEKKSKDKKRDKARDKYRERKNKSSEKDSSNKIYEDSEKLNKSPILTSQVKRAQVGNTEIISIFTSDSIEDHIKKASIFFSIIDGEGRINEDVIDFSLCIDKIVDTNSNKNLSFRKNKINNASIEKGNISLKLYFNENYNRDYKFNLDLEYKS